MIACRTLFSLVVGMDPSSLSPSMVPTYLTHTPEGATVRQFVHYAQLFRNGGRFTRFDRGRLANLLAYSSVLPPEFDLTLVTAPTALYVGAADKFATAEDARLTSQRLADATVNVVDDPAWGHIHFGFSRHAGSKVYRGVVEAMKRFDRVHAGEP